MCCWTSPSHADRSGPGRGAWAALTIAANDGYAEAADKEIRVRQDMEFHQLLARASGNPVFEMILSTLGRLIMESQRQTDPAVVQGTADAHQRILHAVAAGDASAAAQEMRAHLESVERSLRKLDPDAEVSPAPE